MFTSATQRIKVNCHYRRFYQPTIGHDDVCIMYCTKFTPEWEEPLLTTSRYAFQQTFILSILLESNYTSV